MLLGSRNFSVYLDHAFKDHLGFMLLFGQVGDFSNSTFTLTPVWWVEGELLKSRALKGANAAFRHSGHGRPGSRNKIVVAQLSMPPGLLPQATTATE